MSAGQLPIKIGSVIADRFELVGRLGQGGFATVYHARDHDLDRHVAIKLLNLQRLQGRPTFRQNVMERFEREARVAAGLDHPNVVHVFEYGTIEGSDTPYIVMELMEGRDLEEQIFERSALPARRALPLFADCLDALGCAHNQGVVHKDLKPGNIFFVNPDTPNEAFRLLDFGTVSLDNAAAGRLTSTGEILGTPQYLAPEYIDDQVVSPALDVYQMGLILAELLSARPVIDAPTPMRCMLKHIDGAHRVPRALMQSPLGPVLRQALQTDPRARFPNASEFAHALRRVDASQVPAIPPGNIPMARPSTTHLLAPGAFKATVKMSIDPARLDTLKGLGSSRLDELTTHPGIPADLARRLVELEDAYITSEREVPPTEKMAPPTPESMPTNVYISPRGDRRTYPADASAALPTGTDAPLRVALKLLVVFGVAAICVVAWLALEPGPTPETVTATETESSEQNAKTGVQNPATAERDPAPAERDPAPAEQDPATAEQKPASDNSNPHSEPTKQQESPNWFIAE